MHEMTIRVNDGKAYATSAMLLSNEPKRVWNWYAIATRADDWGLVDGMPARYMGDCVAVQIGASFLPPVRFELPGNKPCDFQVEEDVPKPARCKLPLRWEHERWEKYSKVHGWIAA